MYLRTLLIASSVAWARVPSSQFNSDGRCLAGQSCFPGSKEIAAFNASVNGLLYAQRPAGAVCYAGDKSFSAAQCATDSLKFHSDAWIADHAPTYQQPNWEACGAYDSCFVTNSSATNSTAKCSQGSIPQYALHAETSAHVQAYMKFVVKHRLRAVIKNTGHDYTGRSSGQGGFALWIHLLKSVSRDRTFVPKGCKIAPQDSVKFGAGVQWIEAYTFANAQNITVVGGDSPQIGVGGGWLLSGGHSFLSPSYGLGVDNLLEAEIVTPDGELQTASECSNPDIFWAIRGGGGGTFGAVTTVTYKARPSTPITIVVAGVPDVVLNTTQIMRIVSALAGSATAIGDVGMGGLSSLGAGGYYVLGVVPSANQTALRNAVAPVFAQIADLLVPTFVTFPTFFSFYNYIEAPDSTSGYATALSSRLVPRSAFTPSGTPAVLSAIREGLETLDKAGIRTTYQILFAPPTAAHTNVSKTSIHPIWYNSLWHTLYSSVWASPYSPAFAANIYSNIHKAANPLRHLTPGGGAYQNEADTYETDPHTTFWGSNYNRLAIIKKKIDPTNALQVWHGIGSSGANSELFQCYSK